MPHEPVVKPDRTSIVHERQHEIGDMPPATSFLAKGEDIRKAEDVVRSVSPSTPFSLTLESEEDLTSDSQTPSTSGEYANSWGTHDSEALYCVKGWGSPYFSINAAGHLCVHPQGGEASQTRLHSHT